MSNDHSISSHLSETRVFPPPTSFASAAAINWERFSADDEQRASMEPNEFWRQAANDIVWREPWKELLQWTPPRARWFVGGRLNVTESCLDRHLQTDRRTKRAIVWESEGGDVRSLTYEELHEQVCAFAGALKAADIKAGDRVAIGNVHP